MQVERLPDGQVEQGAIQLVQVLPESLYPDPESQIEQTCVDEQTVQPVEQAVQVLFEESANVAAGQDAAKTQVYA